MQILPPSLKSLIEELTILPGVGPKSAQRMAIHILQYKRGQIQTLANALTKCVQNLMRCQSCQSYSETQFCQICNNPQRNNNLICVVESLSDLLSIEQTGIYQGVYFVLYGHLSPIDHIGPEALHIPTLLSQVQARPVEEVILANNATIEGEATAHYIVSHIKKPIKITRLASGIPIGTELAHLNNNTLYQALTERKVVIE